MMWKSREIGSKKVRGGEWEGERWRENEMMWRERDRGEPCRDGVAVSEAPVGAGEEMNWGGFHSCWSLPEMTGRSCKGHVLVTASYSRHHANCQLTSERWRCSWCRDIRAPLGGRGPPLNSSTEFLSWWPKIHFLTSSVPWRSWDRTVMKGILNRIKDTHTHIFMEAVVVCENDNHLREAESGLPSFLVGFP